MFNKIIEPKNKIPEKQQIFSNKRLWILIYPILVEQVLMLLVGIADTLIVSYAGESAVSGVSLINQINCVFQIIFFSLSSGGAVIVSQYIGRGDLKKGNLSAGQLIMISGTFSIAIAVILLLSKEVLLKLLFGKVEADVMQASITYLTITVLSFPALAVYQACSAIFRSMAKTKITMYVSFLMNVINLGGNMIGVFILKAGVAGVAIPSLISRSVATFIMLIACFNKKNIIFVKFRHIFKFDRNIIRIILHIAIPNSIEGGLLEASKVVLSSIVALFGTSQIAANGVSQNFWNMAALFNTVMGPVFITVIGQCIGAKDYEAADYYFRKLLRITYFGAISWNIIFYGITLLVLKLYDLSEETLKLIIIMCLIHNFFNAAFHPCGFTLASGLRAANDVKFTMFTGIFATVIIRVLFSVILGVWFKMGVIGVTFAMAIDWGVRFILILLRYKSGKWRSIQLI
ncbi:mate-domain-containing protein [Neocallimastix lanati (nom. inval.)]|jgi:putative MATE family efflux protein|uniref:Multidrug-efflux transporter n=1 Tax=Neocallimastix californiae TaxID=1754190 RepID=A0A1Y2C4X8_9FUNG|nr:mate-domain-containing protein [Neocallimastix sp. JGI-2020a]ORY42088.1 mate-domain-containing protein [Neocallimastix californiae]|eukprot:ORY42088.1 mate-domain-containing protein [Neocallimastix californiae]